jgi:dTDP-glucose 4,6-dehydratase
MKVLVTGGLGTVGTVLVAELESRGHDVWVCDVPHYHSAKYIRCDVASFNQMARIFENHEFEYVYHLAAEFGRWNGEDYYDTLWRTNMIGTKNIIRLQEKHGFKHVFFSSSEVYGDYDEVMAEDVMDKFEVRQLNDYAMTKWMGEMQVMNSAAQHGTDSVRVRLFNTYGPGEHYSSYRSVACRFIYHALVGMPYTVYLNHHRTSTYVTDTARTLANIVDNFKTGEVYNIGGGQYHDIKYLSDLILTEVGKDDSLVEYVESEPFTTKDKKINVDKAVRDLAHEPEIGLEEGIPKTVDWMRTVYAKEINVAGERS